MRDFGSWVLLLKEASHKIPTRLLSSSNGLVFGKGRYARFWLLGSAVKGRYARFWLLGSYCLARKVCEILAPGLLLYQRKVCEILAPGFCCQRKVCEILAPAFCCLARKVCEILAPEFCC